jgi:SAM-dependent MidA family methyltransferase
MKMTLKSKIRELIHCDGPMSIEQFWQICMSDPQYGYYHTRDPLGAEGDFITAPEISQIFGELIGVWAVSVWQSMGSPASCQLVELGPGRGTLLADALRAAKLEPGFIKAINLHLIETSPYLRNRQAEILQHYNPEWHSSMDGVTKGPTIIIANEFIDALPIRQFVRKKAKWHERCITVDEGDGLQFSAMPEAADFTPPIWGAGGDIFETRPAVTKIVADMAWRKAPLIGLFIDYGHAETSTGDTLQAVYNHQYTDILERPGEVDLTSHVDFADFRRQAEDAGLKTSEIMTQARFLLSLGLKQRCQKLMANSTPAQAVSIKTAASRLVDTRQMGELFKVMVIAKETA